MRLGLVALHLAGAVEAEARGTRGVWDTLALAELGVGEETARGVVDEAVRILLGR
jgi:hypothetical protein